MTQTTRLASSGPNFVTAVHPVAYSVNRTYETSVSIEKTRRNKIKILTYDPNDASGVVWAQFRCSCPPRRV
jgi:hypothetical protein